MLGHGDAPTAVLPSYDHIEGEAGKEDPDTLRVLEMAECRLQSGGLTTKQQVRLLYLCALAHDRLKGYVIVAPNQHTGKHDRVVKDFSLSASLRYLQEAYAAATQGGDPSAAAIGCYMAAMTVRVADITKCDEAIAQALVLLDEVTNKLVCEYNQASADAAMAHARGIISRIARRHNLADPFSQATNSTNE